ncbi:MAG TPA: glycosyl transferase, partial [Flavobacteriales bacterium]|nr:glycosyl transferase [Flavobacteriales bacterium]
MGDVILTSSVVRTVHNQLNCEIHYLIKDSFRDLVKHSPFVHSVHTLSESLESTISKLEKENFDLILDLQKNRKSKKITKELKTEALTFSKLNVKKWILVQSGINLLPKSHLIDRYFDSLKGLGIKNDDLGNELFIPSSISVSTDKLALP